MSEGDPKTIVRALTRAQRRAMSDLGELGAANESVIASLIRRGLATEVDVGDIIGGDSEAFHEMKVLGLALVANTYTPLGQRVQAALSATPNA